MAHYVCPDCSATGKAPDTHVDRRIRCVQCKTPVTVQAGPPPGKVETPNDPDPPSRFIATGLLILAGLILLAAAVAAWLAWDERARLPDGASAMRVNVWLTPGVCAFAFLFLAVLVYIAAQLRIIVQELEYRNDTR